MNNTESSLPIYQLPITTEYPFKNTHITKIFKVDPSAIISLPSATLHTILQTYHKIQSSMLIQISSIENIPGSQPQQCKIHFEYIDTPLHLYIRRFLNQNIRLKIEKFCIELRELAYNFVVKGVNVLQAISVQNIGVKMGQIYRESMAPETKKNQILMPTFKIYVDLNKCQLISHKSNMARIVIETDKMIYSKINAQINELINKIESEEQILNKKMLKNTQINKYKQNYHEFQIKNVGKNAFLKKNGPEQQEQGHLDFTNTIKRRKRFPKQPQSNKQIPKCQNTAENEINAHDTKSQKIIPLKNSCIAEMPSHKLSAQVNDIIERSRKTLKNFKQLIKNQQ